MAWDIVSKDLNSLLTSAEINQLQTNFTALATQSSGAPAINVNSMVVTGVGSIASINGVTIAGGSNTFSVTNGTASLDVAASVTVNIDTSLTVNTETVTINQSLSTTDAVEFGAITVDNTTLNSDTLITTSGNALGLTATDAALNITVGTGAGDDFTINSTGFIYEGDTGNVKIGSGILSVNETTPDASIGGITLNQGANDTSIFTCKSSDVSHPFTSDQEADTFFTIRKGHATNGGAELRAYSLQTGVVVRGVEQTPTTGDTSSSIGCVHIIGVESDGATSFQNMATGDENIFTVANGTLTRTLVKANGDHHITNTNLVVLDDYDDIELARNLQLSIGGDGYKHRVSKKDFDQLVKIGALSSTGEFQIIQGCTAVTLGGLTQLANGLIGLAEHLGISKGTIKSFMRDYKYIGE